MSTVVVPLQIAVVRPSAADYVMKNDRTTALTIVSYQDPALQARVEYAPTSAFEDSELPMATTLQQSLLIFSVAARGAASELAAKTALFELDAAVRGLEVVVRVVWESHAETWTCHAGSRAPAGERGYVDLRDHDPIWNVSLPCHPIPTIT